MLLNVIEQLTAKLKVVVEIAERTVEQPHGDEAQEEVIEEIPIELEHARSDGSSWPLMIEGGEEGIGSVKIASYGDVGSSRIELQQIRPFLILDDY